MVDGITYSPGPGVVTSIYNEKQNENICFARKKYHGEWGIVGWFPCWKSAHDDESRDPTDPLIRSQTEHLNVKAVPSVAYPHTKQHQNLPNKEDIRGEAPPREKLWEERAERGVAKKGT